MSTGGDPGGTAAPGAPASPPPWYQRRAVLLGGGIALILAIAVVTDLPTSATHASDVAAANAFVRLVNADLRPCGFAVQEAYAFRVDQLRGTLSATDRAALPSLLNDDEVACSYADASISDLTSIESPGTAAAGSLGDALSTSLQWVTFDALSAINSIQKLSTAPGNTKALRALAHDTMLLATDRASVNATMQLADASLRATVIAVDLPPLPSPRSVVPSLT